MSTKDQQANQPTGQHPAPGSEHAFEPSGPKGDNSATADPGPTKVQSGTPENRLRRINPSAPGGCQHNSRYHTRKVRIGVLSAKRNPNPAFATALPKLG